MRVSISKTNFMYNNASGSIAFMKTRYGPSLLCEEASAASILEQTISLHATRNFGKTGFREVVLTVFTHQLPAVSYRILHIWKVAESSACSSVFFLTEPSPLHGTALKLVEYPYSENLKIRLKLPSNQNPIIVDPSDCHRSILGTDFSYSDLRFWLPTRRFDFVRFTPEGVRCGFKLSTGGDVTVREARVVLDPTRWLPTTVEWLDAAGLPERIYSATRLVSVDGVWTPRTITVSRPKDQFQSVMTLRRALHGIPIEPALFRTDYLTQLSEPVFEEWIRQAHVFLND
ncbi:MAG TPA: outer membrane lipoprotein-sorting protein [Pyrinomonadaceae bacterium]|nr:outer membrane lipoprotein-sorting protein [Pyrinomonadaceae bacterium]